MGRLLIVLFTLPALAHAQDRARELFTRGTAALQEGRFPEARDLLRESLEHNAHPSTAFNLIVALRGTDDPVGAVELCDRLLGGDFGALAAARRAQAASVCDDARGDVATIEVETFGAENVTIRIDGSPAGEVRAGERFERTVNPGRRVVAATAPGHAGDEQVVNVERGGRARVMLRLVPIAVDGPTGSGDDSLLWWLVGGSAVAVVVAIVVLAAVLAPQPGQPEGGDFPITMTLRAF